MTVGSGGMGLASTVAVKVVAESGNGSTPAIGKRVVGSGDGSIQQSTQLATDDD